MSKTLMTIRSANAWNPTNVRSVNTDGNATGNNNNAANPTNGAVADRNKNGQLRVVT